MTDWSKDVSSHPIWVEIAQLRARLDSIGAPDDQNDLGDWLHVERAVGRADSAKRLPGTVVPKELLDQANSHATALNGSIANFESTNDTAHLTEAGVHADRLLFALLPLDAVLRVRDADSLPDPDRAAIDAVARIADRQATAFSTLDIEVAARQSELEHLSAELAERQQQLDSLATETATETGRLQAKIEAQETGVEALHEELRSGFAARAADTIHSAEAAFSEAADSAQDTMSVAPSAPRLSRLGTKRTANRKLNKPLLSDGALSVRVPCWRLGC